MITPYKCLYMHRIHGGFTAAFPIKEEGAETSSLSGMLAFLHNNSSHGAASFDQSETTLFASGVVLPAQYYKNEKLPPTFVLATTYCGPLKAHLYDLIATNKNILLKLLMFCKDFNSGYDATDEDIYRFLKKHSYASNFNSRCNYISKQDTKNEKALRNEIEEYIDRAQALGAFKYLSAKQVRKCIQQHIIACGEQYAWALKPFRKNWREWLETVRPYITAALLVITGLALGLALLAPFILIIAILLGANLNITIAQCLAGCIPGLFIAIVLQRLMYMKTPTAQRPPDSRVQQLAATQLKPVLNEMTAAAPLKAGFLRPFLYASLLRILGMVGPILLNIPTVSNIRWLVIDNKKRLLFLSCYSNTTDFYVRDFLVGDTAKGVNFMFTHGQGFPDARWLFRSKGIIKDPEGYMHAVHTGQCVTQFWYAHEKHLTADIIKKNREIRNGLFKWMTEEEASEWLKLL
jgi:hypothetical protein